jgi:transposase-like protein
MRTMTELRQRAIRMVAESKVEYPSEFAAIEAVARKLGIGSPETLRKWIIRVVRHLPARQIAGVRAGLFEVLGPYRTVLHIRTAVGQGQVSPDSGQYARAHAYVLAKLPDAVCRPLRRELENGRLEVSDTARR